MTLNHQIHDVGTVTLAPHRRTDEQSLQNGIDANSHADELAERVGFELASTVVH